MVLTMNALIMIAVVFLCIMRMSPDSTPCWATLWGGYVGSVALCNGMCSVLIVSLTSYGFQCESAIVSLYIAG